MNQALSNEEGRALLNKKPATAKPKPKKKIQGANQMMDLGESKTQRFLSHVQVVGIVGPIEYAQDFIGAMFEGEEIILTATIKPKKQ